MPWTLGGRETLSRRGVDGAGKSCRCGSQSLIVPVVVVDLVVVIDAIMVIEWTPGEGLGLLAALLLVGQRKGGHILPVGVPSSSTESDGSMVQVSMRDSPPLSLVARPGSNSKACFHRWEPLQHAFSLGAGGFADEKDLVVQGSCAMPERTELPKTKCRLALHQPTGCINAQLQRWDAVLSLADATSRMK